MLLLRTVGRDPVVHAKPHDESLEAAIGFNKTPTFLPARYGFLGRARCRSAAMDPETHEPKIRLVQVIAKSIAGMARGPGETAAAQSSDAVWAAAQTIVAALCQASDDADPHGDGSIWILSSGPREVVSLKMDSQRGAQITELMRFV
jgi:hypothetical protein